MKAKVKKKPKLKLCLKTLQHVARRLNRISMEYRDLGAYNYSAGFMAASCQVRAMASIVAKKSKATR